MELVLKCNLDKPTFHFSEKVDGNGCFIKGEIPTDLIQSKILIKKFLKNGLSSFIVDELVWFIKNNERAIQKLNDEVTAYSDNLYTVGQGIIWVESNGKNISFSLKLCERNLTVSTLLSLFTNSSIPVKIRPPRCENSMPIQEHLLIIPNFC